MSTKDEALDDLVKVNVPSQHEGVIFVSQLRSLTVCVCENVWEAGTQTEMAQKMQGSDPFSLVPEGAIHSGWCWGQALAQGPCKGHQGCRHMHTTSYSTAEREKKQAEKDPETQASRGNRTAVLKAVWDAEPWLPRGSLGPDCTEIISREKNRHSESTCAEKQPHHMQIYRKQNTKIESIGK